MYLGRKTIMGAPSPAYGLLAEKANVGAHENGMASLDGPTYAPCHAVIASVRR